MVEDANSIENLENRYKALFQLVPISIWEEDFSEVKVFLDDLQANGVSDFKKYFSEHPDSILDMIRLIHVVDVNDYTITMFEARDKAELLGSIEKTLTRESLMTFKDAIIAFVEGKPYFEGESIGQTLGGKMLNILMKIRYPEKPEQLNRVISTIIDITRIKELEMLEQQDSRIVFVLAGLASRLLEPLLSKQDICEMVLEYGQSLTSSENGLVLVFEESSLEIKAYASNGLAPSFIVSRKMPDQEGSIESIINRKNSCFTNEPGNDACLPDESTMEITVKNYMHVPVIASGQLLGHIILANSNRDYDSGDIRSIEQLAQVFTLAVLKSRAERKLQESENRYRNLFDNMSSGVAIYEAIEDGNDFIIKGFNKAAESIDQVNAAEIIGKRVMEVFPGIEEMGLLDAFRSVQNTGIQQFLPSTLYKDRRISGWRENFVCRLSNGEIVAIYNDVTEKINAQQLINEAEEKLRKSEEKYRLITEESNDSISVVSRDYKIEYANEAYERLLGYKTNELVGRSGLGFIHPDDIKHALAIFARLRDMGQKEAIIELRLRHKDGHYIDFEVKAKSILFNDMPGLLLVGRDITDRKISSAKLEESEERYRIMLENASDGVTLLDGNMQTEYVNENEAKILGYERQELLGSSALAFDRIHPDDLENAIEIFKDGFERGEGSGEFRILHKDGHYIWFDVKGKTFVDKDGKKWALLLSRDISESKKIKEELIQSERRFRELNESLPIPIFECNIDLYIIYCNQAAYTMFGYVEDDLKKGLNIKDTIIEEDIAKAAEVFGLLARGEKIESPGREYTAIKKDGTTFPVLINTITIMKDGNPVGFRGFLLDYSDKKRVEESEARYRLMLENASDMVEVLDENMKHEYVNENELKLLGYEMNDLIGKSVLNLVHPDDIKSGIEQFMAGFARGEGTGDFRIRHKDGHFIWFEIKGKTFIDPDGTTKALLLSRDISESKRIKEELMELNRELEHRVEERTRDLKGAQEKLIRQEKLAAAGKISSTISHELRNPLAAISNSIYYLNMKLGNADEKIRKHIELIQAEVERSRQIISNLLDFTRIKPPQFSKVSLLSVIKTSLSHVTVPDNVTIETEDNANDIQLEIDPDLMQQVFINIITNAIQAMPQGGNLYITIGSDEKQVTVAFKDSGVGISPENIQKLFEPLFTTKKSGIGLGLALVKDIIDKHGGEINVESDEGLGTTFTIILPFTHVPA